MCPSTAARVSAGSPRSRSLPAKRGRSTRITVALMRPSVLYTSRDTLPDGQIFHAAGPSAGGWTIVAVHESKDSWERFRDQTLLPRMQSGIAGGFAGPPQETEIDIDTLMP